MKHLVILLTSFALLSSASAQTSAALAADLQTIDASHWPAINALLIAQREELNAAHAATLASSAADFKSQLSAANTARDTALAARVAALVEQQRAEAKLKLLVDGAKDALSKATSEERLAAGNALLAKVQASQSDEEKAALLQQQAEIAAKLQALETATQPK